MQEYNPNDPDSDFAYGHNIAGSDSDGAQNTAAGYWFGVFYVLFYLSDTFTNVPYEALGPEMHPDPDVCRPAVYYDLFLKTLRRVFMLAAQVPGGI